MGCWVGIFNRRNWWSTSDMTMYEGATFIINNNMSRTWFEGILSSLRYTDRKDVEYIDGFFPYASNGRIMEHEHS